MYEKFGIDLTDEQEADVVMFGALLGERAEEMMKSLRKTSWFVEFYDVDQQKNLIEGLKIADAGDIEVKTGNEITEKVEDIIKRGKFPFMFCISHLATYFPLKALPKDVKIVSFDAHFDTKNNYIDEKMVESVFPLDFDEEKIKKFNRGTWARRSFEENKREYCFVGARSGDEFDVQFMKDNNFLYFTPKMIRENFDEVKSKLREFVKNSKIYLTFDIDVFDPSIAPGVGHPEPDGVFWHQVQALLHEVSGGKIVGADLVEVEPMKDNIVTEFLAVRTIFEILSLIKT